MEYRLGGLAVLAVLALFVSVLNASEVTDKNVVSARLECCAYKWRTFPMVRTFGGQDLHLFHNVYYRDVFEAEPQLLLLNLAGEVVERFDLSDRTREGMNQLLLKKGFYKKKSRDDLVPEKYRMGPYVSREEL